MPVRRERSAGAVIFIGSGGERRYLLLHYLEGHWDLVKGHIEGAETERQAAAREAREEAGLADLVFVEGFRERIGYSFRRPGGAVHKDVVFFAAQTKQEKITLSREHKGFAWLPYKDALARLTYDNARNVLGKAHERLSGGNPGR
ncbi:MAG: NUDIX domain-containing protein [Euryarchaeota archaeon]|nr:NUDIX domain-containing protein [Euryarchaeota archaeon]